MQRLFGTVIMPAFEFDNLQTLEQGYRNVMWKYHEALTLIANNTTSPKDVAQRALGKNKPISIQTRQSDE